MSNPSKYQAKFSPEQQAIRAKSFYPEGKCVEFTKAEIEQSIPARFERVVQAHPHRLAVKSKERSLTYEALNRAADRIAHAVLEKCGPGSDRVALLLEDGIDVIAAILGVLKAGKIYVPLDLSFPISRNRDILEDSEPGLIVINNESFPLAKALASKELPLINFDELYYSSLVENPNLPLASDRLAYILYTSGSTGKPKGVVQNHRNILHLVMRHTHRANVCPEDRIALCRSFSVHGGTLMTFVALLNGAVILPFNIRREGLHGLADWLAHEEITLCRMGPTLFRHFAEILGENHHYPSLREISFSGEPLHKADVESCRKLLSADCVIVNSFGATEVSSCCEYVIQRGTRIEEGVVPCGVPVTDVKIVLQRDDGTESGVGEIGEIAVKSRYLALEYWRKPELTRAKFLPSPSEKAERIYLTGDLGQILPDGSLIHLGRKDFQVKIRGYRVELAEIEAKLLSLDNIKEAVVVGRGDYLLEKHLVAYVVPDRFPAPKATRLRRALEKQLPQYMMPEAFVVLRAMPLTPSGKIDRSALLAPSGFGRDLDTPYALPRSPIEEAVSRIWAEVLGVDSVGIHDNFFDLGGHSLRATQIIARIIGTFKLEIPIKFLLNSSTVAEMAVIITEHQAEKLSAKDLDRILNEVESLTDEQTDGLLKNRLSEENRDGQRKSD